MRVLNEIRRDIDDVDDALKTLFLRRLGLAREAGAAKRARGAAIGDPAREEQVLARAAAGLTEKEAMAMREFFSSVIGLSRRNEE